MFEYERAFQQAAADQERGRWHAARMNYARAGQLLIAQAPNVAPSEWNMVMDSAGKLLAAAEEMKRREEAERKNAQRREPAVKRTSGEPVGRSDDDEAQFTPTPECPNVHFDDLAGLEDAKRVIREEILEPYRRPELYQRFDQNTNGGILLYGLPGTGKTMLAKCIATETDADFFPIRCSDIVGKYFGEAERRLKALFNAARESGNAIVFFDEFEALACQRGGHSTVMNRVVPELLSQMDGFEKHDGRLVVVAATNRPWALDSAFLRPPRLTHHIYVPLPDREARMYLLRRGFQKLPCQGEIDFDRIADATEGFNCADVANLVNQVTRGPIRRGIQSDNYEQFVTRADVEDALASAHSSVRPNDVDEMEKWLAAR